VRTMSTFGYGNDSVARVLLLRELVSIVLGSFLLNCDIMQRDRWVPTFRRNVEYILVKLYGFIFKKKAI